MNHLHYLKKKKKIHLNVLVKLNKYHQLFLNRTPSTTNSYYPFSEVMINQIEHQNTIRKKKEMKRNLMKIVDDEIVYEI